MAFTGAYSQQHTAPLKPEDVVNAFYQYHFSHDMGFTEASIKAKKAWFTEDLYKKMLAKIHQPVPKGEEPDIDGDPFTWSQEYPASFKITGGSINGTKATVGVQFSWPDSRKDVLIILLHQPAGWLIDDVIFQANDSLRLMLRP